MKLARPIRVSPNRHKSVGTIVASNNGEFAPIACCSWRRTFRLARKLPGRFRLPGYTSANPAKVRVWAAEPHLPVAHAITDEHADAHADHFLAISLAPVEFKLGSSAAPRHSPRESKCGRAQHSTALRVDFNKAGCRLAVAVAVADPGRSCASLCDAESGLLRLYRDERIGP
jgi:hypothetical protein